MFLYICSTFNSNYQSSMTDYKVSALVDGATVVGHDTNKKQQEKQLMKEISSFNLSISMRHSNYKPVFPQRHGQKNSRLKIYQPSKASEHSTSLSHQRHQSSTCCASSAVLSTMSMSSSGTDSNPSGLVASEAAVARASSTSFRAVASNHVHPTSLSRSQRLLVLPLGRARHGWAPPPLRATATES